MFFFCFVFSCIFSQFCFFLENRIWHFMWIVSCFAAFKVTCTSNKQICACFLKLNINGIHCIKWAFPFKSLLICFQVAHCLYEILDQCRAFTSLVSRCESPMSARDTAQLELVAKVIKNFDPLTHCRLNDSPYAIYWKILVLILRMSGYVI